MAGLPSDRLEMPQPQLSVRAGYASSPTQISHVWAYANGDLFAPVPRTLAKRFVYILQSDRDVTRYYTGLTSNLSARLLAHNAGQCAHTASGRPWRVIVSIEFSEESTAARFERYLKSGSGGAFSKRHFR